MTTPAPRSPRSPRDPALSARRAPALLLLALALAACGDDGQGGGGPNLPQEARRTCAAPVRLAVGESAELGTGEDGRVLCAVDAGTGAEYVVAVADTRAARKARTEPEGYGAAFEPYTVAVGTGTEVPKPVPGAQGALASAASAQPHLVPLAATAPRPDHVASSRETPWTLGESFALYDANVQAPRTARVLRIYDGHFVVAWLEGDNTALLPLFLAQLDSAWEAVGRHGLPLMRSAYSQTLPHTSPGSGQYLVVLRAEGRGGALGWTIPDRFYGAPRYWTDIKVLNHGSALRLAELVSHELAHAFQAMYMDRTRPAGAAESAAGATFWGVEGGADLVSFETVRRAAGVPLAANFDALAASAGTPAERRLGQWGQPGMGILSDGYANSAGFLRILAAQRVAAGEPVDQAVGEVLRGASDGWYGFDSYGSRRTGLAERMRARLGAEWSPEEALLDWALAHGADDRTSNARFQDPTFRRVSGLPPSIFGAWRPMTTLSGNTSTYSTAAPRGYGSSHYLFLQGSGEILFSAASDVPGLRWKIVRVE